MSIFLAGWDHQPVYAEFSQSYEYYLQQAQDALDQNDYEAALDHFKHAHLIDPSTSYPIEQIEKIEHVMQGDLDSGELPAGHANRSYRLFLGLGKKAWNEGRYADALPYFETAIQINPNDQEANRYVNLIKRANDDRMARVVSAVYETEPVYVTASPSRDPTTESREQEAVEPDRDQSIANALDEFESRSDAHQKIQLELKSAQNVLTPEPSSNTTQTPHLRPTQPVSLAKTLALDDALRATQPKTDLKLEFKKSVIMEGHDIERFLVITPGVINVERIDRDHIKLTAQRIATTYLHVWDERGRWTFYVEIVLPIDAAAPKSEPKSREQESAEPIEFRYAIDGGTLYRGPNLPSVKKQSLDLSQTMQIAGDTPYGQADAGVSLNKLQESTQATSYTVGLHGAQGLGFTDVHIRAFDATKYFSALTFPGQYFRGILLEGKTIGENLGATYLFGRDRYTYSFLSPNGIEDRESYVEGARVVLFPNEENRYGFNYARGFGPQRATYLRNEVYSVDARHKFDRSLIYGEVAGNNDDTYAETLAARFDGGRQSYRASFRNIDDDFTTISNPPSNQGQVGALLSGDWNYESFDLSSNADIYRTRLTPNRDNPNALNYDLDTSIRVPINPTLRWTTTGYYLDTPGELSVRRSFRLVNDLSKTYRIWNGRDLQIFVGSIYQRNRVGEVPVADYDRYSATTGFQIGLLKGLSYYANYEYSWVDNLTSSGLSNPHVLNTGLTYSHEFTKRLTGTLGFFYRNEENTQGTNSFLAGEDSITGSLGMSYRPTENSEIFWDSRVRNVWRENPENEAYNEIDTRWGLRSAWDLPVSWNPHGTIRGRVYKDINGNAKRDPDEPGIAKVKIKVGKKEVATDQWGNYSVPISAKRVLVRPDLSTIPSGFVLTTPAVLEISIPQARSVDFGLTTDSGIYGVVFYDKNGNNQPDEGDVFIPKVKMILDNALNEQTEYDGTYFFKDVKSGSHTIRFDINSIPIEYLPLVKVTNTVNVTEGTTYVYHIPLKKK